MNGTSNATVAINNRWLTVVTSRLGYAWDRVPVHGQAGGAFVGVDPPSLTVTNAGALAAPSSNRDCTAGAGVEWAFHGNWSARAEFNYIQLMSRTPPLRQQRHFLSLATRSHASHTIVNLLVMAGPNHKFGLW
jgi:opacity protein-like surface antigen